MSLYEPGILTDLRILVVENDADMRDLLALVLRAEGAEVSTAATAGDAFELLDEQRFDALLSEADLPDESGWRLVETVRQRPPEQGGRVPAIAITALAYPADRVRSRASGFDLHFSKPVEMRRVIAAIARLVARPAPPAH